MIFVWYFSILRRFSHVEWEYLPAWIAPWDISETCLPLQTWCNFSVPSYLLIQLQPEIFTLILVYHLHFWHSFHYTVLHLNLSSLHLRDVLPFTNQSCLNRGLITSSAETWTPKIFFSQAFFTFHMFTSLLRKILCSSSSSKLSWINAFSYHLGMFHDSSSLPASISYWADPFPCCWPKSYYLFL